MQFHPVYKQLGYHTPDDVFKGLIETLHDGISGWDYFVDWGKVASGILPIEPRLNLLNTLIGKEDIVGVARDLFRTYPEILSVLPILLAVREKKLSILTDYKKGLNAARKFDFGKPIEQVTPADIEDGITFLSDSGFFDLIRKKNIKSFVDYVMGVEVGLDTNGRKNRSGKSMENVVGFFLENLCQKVGLPPPLWQATRAMTQQTFGKEFTVDKANRKVDFAVDLQDRLLLVEVNFYGANGSKAKATAEEYITRQSQWRRDGHLFIWVTDGKGWGGSQAPLREAFNSIDHILNLEMMHKGVFEALLNL